MAVAFPKRPPNSSNAAASEAMIVSLRTKLAAPASVTERNDNTIPKTHPRFLIATLPFVVPSSCLDREMLTQHKEERKTSLPLLVQPLQELDLAGMVDVVVGHAEDKVQEARLAPFGDGLQILVPKGRDSLAEVAVHVREDLEVRLPGLVAGLSFGPGEPVAPLEREPDLRAQTVEDGVLPVRRVHGEL